MRTISKLSGLIGETPLYEITSYPLREGVRLFAKLEFMNIGGSIKDRLGFYLLQQAVANHKVKKGDTIIEATAGNTGIGLALAAIHYQLDVIFVTPEKFSVEKQDRKSTRLNSSHVAISYADFCLKKKNK